MRGVWETTHACAHECVLSSSMVLNLQVVQILIELMSNDDEQIQARAAQLMLLLVCIPGRWSISFFWRAHTRTLCPEFMQLNNNSQQFEQTILKVRSGPGIWLTCTQAVAWTWSSMLSQGGTRFVPAAASSQGRSGFETMLRVHDVHVWFICLRSHPSMRLSACAFIHSFAISFLNFVVVAAAGLLFSVGCVYQFVV